MSLLLDALKKAADEKKKESSSLDASQGEIKESIENIDEAVDLNLELNQEEGDGFPEVNQEIIKQVEIEPVVENVVEETVEEIELALEQDNDLETKTQSDDVSQLKVSDQVEAVQDMVDIDSVKSESIVTESKTTPVENKLSQESLVRDSKPVKDSPREQTPRRQQVARQEQKRNRDMEALSALINKNNEYRDKNRRIVNLSIISTILLVLIGASLYAYILLDNVDSSRVNNSLIDEVDTLASENTASSVDRAQVKETAAISPIVKVPEENNANTRNQAVIAKEKSVKPAIKKAIQIRKKITKDPIGVLLAQAYAAFKKSEFKTSEKLYYKVINRDKNNRDALLGLAAIAVKHGSYEDAKQIYIKLLKLDPKDSYAKAGLSALINQKHALMNESQLKLMLREQPEVGHLHFALGNLMLSQKRFAEAQTSFFNAWSNNKSNSDYAYNLAVSLDHLGKPEHAAEFYELTVKLYKASGGNLVLEDVKQRLIQIKGQKNE